MHCPPCQDALEAKAQLEAMLAGHTGLRTEHERVWDAVEALRSENEKLWGHLMRVQYSYRALKADTERHVAQHAALQAQHVTLQAQHVALQMQVQMASCGGSAAACDESVSDMAEHGAILIQADGRAKMGALHDGGMAAPQRVVGTKGEAVPDKARGGKKGAGGWTAAGVEEEEAVKKKKGFFASVKKLLGPSPKQIKPSTLSRGP